MSDTNPTFKDVNSPYTLGYRRGYSDATEKAIEKLTSTPEYSSEIEEYQRGLNTGAELTAYSILEELDKLERMGIQHEVHWARYFRNWVEHETGVKLNDK